MLLFANVTVNAQSGSATSTCPLLSLSNPGPGDQVSAGDYNVHGVAIDGVTGAPTSVDLFLGTRDNGGTYLATAMPGTDPNNPAAFNQEVTFPNVNRLDVFTAYATSTHGAGTTTVSVPIRIGSPPRSIAPATPTPVAASVTVKSNCPTILVSPTGAQVTGAVAPVVAVRQNQGPVLQIANPQAGDFVSRGDYISYGVAFDPNSASGPGVDQVSYYLGARDNGGVFIGSGTPGVIGGPTGGGPEVTGPFGGGAGAYSAELTFPNNASGLQNIFAYAHSSVTGRETSVSIPVDIRSRLTPTPTS
jgi:hypothetical protein